LDGEQNLYSQVDKMGTQRHNWSERRGQIHGLPPEVIEKRVHEALELVRLRRYSQQMNLSRKPTCVYP
jgi:hypothetical protein